MNQLLVLLAADDLFASSARGVWALGEAIRLTASLPAGATMLAPGASILRPVRGVCRARGVALIAFEPDGRRTRDDAPESLGWRALAGDAPDAEACAAALCAAAARAAAAGWTLRVVALTAPGVTRVSAHAARHGLAPEVRAYAPAAPPSPSPTPAWPSLPIHPTPREGLTTLEQIAAARATFSPGDLLFADTETTGKVAGLHGLVEIGIVRTNPTGQVVRAEWEAKVFPHDGCAIDPEAVEICGYDPDVWRREAIPQADALDALDLLLADKPVFAGHNPSFDYRFITFAYTQAGRAMPPVWGDSLNTVRHANALKKRGLIPNAKLETVARYLGIDTTVSHRALPDARRSREVLVRLAAIDPGALAT